MFEPTHGVLLKSSLPNSQGDSARMHYLRWFPNENGPSKFSSLKIEDSNKVENYTRKVGSKVQAKYIKNLNYKLEIWDVLLR